MSSVLPLLTRMVQNKVIKYPTILAKAVVNIIDAWTGDALSEAMRDELGLSREIEEGKVTIAELEKLKNAITGDLNRLQSEIEQLRDPSEFMTNEVVPAINALGFTVNRNLRDKLLARSANRDSDITKARRAYLDERDSLNRQIANKTTELTDVQNRIDEQSRKIDDIKSTNPASMYLSQEGHARRLKEGLK